MEHVPDLYCAACCCAVFVAAAFGVTLAASREGEKLREAEAERRDAARGTDVDSQE